jgi:hypothetical protein
MKIALFALCLLGATFTFGQAATVLSNVSSPIAMAEHPQRATEHSLGQEVNLLGSSAYSYAQGEQPLADFGTLKVQTPLGDVARTMRKAHAFDRKAAKVLTNQ